MYANKKRFYKGPIQQEYLCFDIKGIPFAKQSFRFTQLKSKTKKTFMIKYQPKKIIKEEKNIRAQIVAQLPEGFQPFTKAVVIRSLCFMFPLPKSSTKKRKDLVDLGANVYKITRPDLTDNLMKGLFDAMKGVVFLDDSQVALIQRVSKIYHTTPGIKIVIDEIETEVSGDLE